MSKLSKLLLGKVSIANSLFQFPANGISTQISKQFIYTFVFIVFFFATPMFSDNLLLFYKLLIILST